MSEPQDKPPVYVLAHEPEQASNGIVIAGYVLAFLIPFVGFVISIVLMAKRRIGHGIGVLVVCIVAFIFWLTLLVGGAASAVDGYATCLDQAQTAAEINACSE